MKIYVYQPGEAEPVTQSVAVTDNPGLARLDEILRPLLDGADLEHVSVLFRGREADMFVDELGASKGLPVNEAATAIYHATSLFRSPKADPSGWPSIHGPAVIFDRIVWR